MLEEVKLNRIALLLKLDGSHSESVQKEMWRLRKN